MECYNGILGSRMSVPLERTSRLNDDFGAAEQIRPTSSAFCEDDDALVTDDSGIILIRPQSLYCEARLVSPEWFAGWVGGLLVRWIGEAPRLLAWKCMNIIISSVVAAGRCSTFHWHGYAY